jgi:CubicO group peptidase (beta-lactamase class C family)
MKFTSILLLILLSHLAFSQDRMQKLDSLLNALNAKGQINGSFLIAEKGQIIYNKSFGLANEATQEKLTENSVFELASVSKQFTAMAIMILSEQGKLKLKDPIGKYIPELAFYKNVTVGNLVHHTGGLADYMEEMDGVFDKNKIATNNDIIQIFAEKKPKILFKPNSKFEYSNTGYALLATIIERTSGLSYGEFLDKNIFKPLDMKSTLVYNRRYAPKKVDHYALGYIYSEKLDKYVLPDDVEDSKMVIWLDGIVGDGCVNSTVLDLLKWDRALYTNKLLSPEGMKQVFTSGILKDKTKSNYGSGWFLEDLKDFGKIVKHSGGWPGYRTYIERHIDSDKTIIILQNHNDVSFALDRIRRILYGKLLQEERVAKEIKIADEVADQYAGLYQIAEDNYTNIVKRKEGYFTYENGGLSKMHFYTQTDFFNVDFPTDKHFISDASGKITGYKIILHGTEISTATRIQNPEQYKGKEDFFNTAGWSFLINDQYAEAIKYLKLGVEKYPGSLFLKGNLAHSYLFNQDYTSAIALYKTHLNESLTSDFSWKDMIQQDFVLFKDNGMDVSLMKKTLAELNLDVPWTESSSNETEDKIKAFENSLAGRVIVENEPPATIIDRMKYYNVQGLSIAVIHNYEVAWAKGYGWADVEEKRPVTAETLFEPGSISKSLNAVGILKLAQDKKLDLYTDINTYLTSWKFPYDTTSHNKKITLAQLLSHSAGLGVHGFPGYDLLATLPTLTQVLNGQAPANTPPVRSIFEPGLRHEYSGGGTTISQLLLMDITKQPYDVFMYDYVLKPMGMTNSFYTQPAPGEKHNLCATGYYTDGNPVPHKFHAYPEQAAAGLWMTPTDLCHYIIEMQLSKEGKSNKVLNQEMTQLMLTPYNDVNAALGVFVEDRKGTLYFQHGAGNEGFCGQYYGSIEGGDGVVIFLNSDYNPGLMDELLNSIARVYNWTNFYEPIYKKMVEVPDNIAKECVGMYTIGENGFTDIVKKEDGYYLCDDRECGKIYFTSETEFFNKEFGSEKQIVKNASGEVTGYLRRFNGEALPQAFKVIDPATLSGSEDFFNTIGWYLLGCKRYNEAAQYLKRGLQLYPSSLVIEGNLAHAYLFKNDYAAAIKIYKSHIGKKIDENFMWNDMIAQDFLFFKRKNFDKKLMDKILSDLKLKGAEGY